MIELDETDRTILRALTRDATQTAAALGGRIGLSQPATWRRIKRLREVGILAGQRISLDAQALGFGVTVFLGIKLATKGRVSLDDFERAVTAIPEVQLVEHVLGLYDYRLRVVARDLADFDLATLKDLFEQAPVRSVAVDQMDEQLDWLFRKYEATHVAAISTAPLLLIAFNNPALMTTEDAGYSLAALQRVAAQIAGSKTP